MVAGGTAVQLGIVVASILGLWVGARSLVAAVVRLARQFGLSELIIGLTVVAVGTSLPELVVTGDAAVKGLGDIAVGNVLGSNIYNLAFILGIVSLVRIVPVERSLIHRDGLALVATSLLGGAVLLDGSLSWSEGALLVALFVAYTTYLLTTGTEEAGDDALAVPPTERRPDQFRRRDGVLLVGGLVVVLVSGDLLVGAASTLARAAGLSEWVIGGTIVAAGTSTPEFAVSLVALRSGRLGVSVGNVVGSNVFNLLGVMGLAGLLGPLAVSGAALESVAWLAVVTIAMVAALWTGRQLSRPEGGLFALSEVVRWTLGLLG
jgi:cation:H+ antiporter